MTNIQQHQLISGLRITSLGTLASRVLGMLRDMATAALLGLSSSGIMDAFVVAFRVPNLFRRLLGEGALSASYLPILTATLDKDRRLAWQLASATFTLLAIALAALVLLGEVLCGLLAWSAGDHAQLTLVIGLLAVMLPYAWFICLAAQLSATLHALGHFSVPALTPVLLNVCWLAAALVVAPAVTSDKGQQVYVLAAAILVAGVLQAAWQVPMLRRLGFRFELNWAATREPIVQILTGMGPMILGLAVTQINTFFDTFVAWGLAQSPDEPQQIAWLGGAVDYPLRQGAAAATYFGERLYQFPVGTVGLAVATAIFPLLSRHATRGNHDLLAADLTLGLRLVTFLAVPASAGLVLLAEPITRLLFEHGEFTPEDTIRTAGMIACYGLGVWAYCALPVMVRGFYAMGDRTTPVKVGAAVVGVNVALNLILIWPLAERGLALSTAIAAALQIVWLAAVFSGRLARLDWPALLRTITRTCAATMLMTACGFALLTLFPRGGGGIASELVHVVAGVVVCGLVYFASAWLLGLTEIRILFSGWNEEPPKTPGPS